MCLRKIEQFTVHAPLDQLLPGEGGRLWKDCALRAVGTDQAAQGGGLGSVPELKEGWGTALRLLGWFCAEPRIGLADLYGSLLTPAILCFYAASRAADGALRQLSPR